MLPANLHQYLSPRFQQRKMTQQGLSLLCHVNSPHGDFYNLFYARA